jgi:hypothetical protein
MTPRLRASTLRSIVGAALLLASALVALFVLPDASKALDQQRKAASQAQRNLTEQLGRLVELQKRAEMIRQGRLRMEQLEANMPKGSVGELQWSLSRTLADLAKVHGVRVSPVKYGSPGREGAKGTDLENLDVDFTALGVYQSLKKFMLALEGSGLPFGVSAAKLDEGGPEGARLTITLRAFRRAGAVSVDAPKEES